MPHVTRQFLKQSRKESKCKLGVRACQAVRYLCRELNCHQDGIPSQACRGVERYIAHLAQRGVGSRQILHRMTSQFFLIAASAAWLAAKMLSATTPLCAATIRTALAAVQGTDYSVPEIRSMEIKMMRALAHNVPLFTINDMANHLAAMVQVEPANRSSLQQLLRLLAVFRRLADESVEHLLRTRGITARPRVLTIEYAAGAVAAVVGGTATAARLARLIGVSPGYVECVRDALVSQFAKRYYEFTPDELRALEECDRESFYRRCLPFSTLFAALTYAGIKTGHVARHPHFGALPKVALAALAGHWLGRVCFLQQCDQRLRQLPASSHLGNTMRGYHHDRNSRPNTNK